MAKKKILMVCEAFGGGVFTYVSQLCNDMVDEFDIYLAYSLRPQTPKNYKDFLDQRVHLIEMKNVGVKGLTNFKSDIAAIKELRQIEKEIQPDVIHLHSSVAGGLGRLAYKEKNNTVVYTPHGYAHILMGPGKKSKVYKFAEKVLGNRALTLTCCESEDEEAKKFSKRTAHVETGVNLSDLSASLDGIKSVKNDKFTVFTLGRACVQKQPQLFNRIAELVPDARFIWIGNGELESELTAPNIEVTGYGALINAAVNIALIRFIGLQAASVSTFLGFLIMWLIREKQNRDELNVTIDKKHFLLLFCPTLILSLAECFTGLYIDIVLSFLGIAVFLFVNRKMISLLLVKIHKKCEIDRVKKHE